MKIYRTFPLICLLSLISVGTIACTIFVLTNSKKTLFFNNEDWKNPSTRIWFVPESKESYGVAFLGFNNNFAQGGVNTKGLAYDAVADGKHEYDATNLIKIKGDATPRMLATCSTVDEAIAFYQKYAEPNLGYGRILVADKTGASIIVEAKHGKLLFNRSDSSRGFGYGRNVLEKELEPGTKASLKAGLPILNACIQPGEYGTKYSNVFDLKSGEITLINTLQNKQLIKLNLKKELAKGPHYYDLPKINQQLKEPLLTLDNSKNGS